MEGSASAPLVEAHVGHPYDQQLQHLPETRNSVDCQHVSNGPLSRFFLLFYEFTCVSPRARSLVLTQLSCLFRHMSFDYTTGAYYPILYRDEFWLTGIEMIALGSLSPRRESACAHARTDAANDAQLSLSCAWAVLALSQETTVTEGPSSPPFWRTCLSS